MGGGGYYPPEPPHPFRHEYPPSFGRPWPGPGYQPSMSSTRASLGTGSEMGSEPPDGDGDDEGDSAQSCLPSFVALSGVCGTRSCQHIHPFLLSN